MERKKIFLLGLAVCIAPFLFCFVANRSFAPMETLYNTNLPYSSGRVISPPNNHFWSDTVNFYWPRFSSIARHEFPISFSAGGGSPIFADTISGFFSPYCLLVFGLLPTGLHSLDLLWLLQFSIYFSGLFFWFSLLGASPIGALLGALSQTYCTAFFPGSYLSFQTLGALSFLPWALWANDKFAKSAKRLWMPSLFLALGIFSGNIQTALYPLLIFGLWGVFRKELFYTFYAAALAILFSLPLWLPGIQYHVLLSLHTLGERHSQVPTDFLGRLRTLLALPGIFLPELFGSSKSIDFLKGLQTSATYFIGSIGLLGPLLCLLCWKRELLRKREIRFALALLAFSLLVMVTPLLNLLYYRIICVVCFALSLLLALCFEEFFSAKVLKRKNALVALSISLAAVSSLSFLLKQKFHERITSFLLGKLSVGSYAWDLPLLHARIDRWFASYLCTPHFLGMVLLLIGVYIALQKKSARTLALVIFLDSFLVWSDQVTLDKLASVEHPSFALIKEELQKSPSYPASRFFSITCDPKSGFLFNFSLYEYQGVPTIDYYGSTNIARLPQPSVRCDQARHEIAFLDPSKLQKSALNVFVTHSDWIIQDPNYHPIFKNADYTIWSREAFSAIWSSEIPILAKTESWDGSGLRFQIDAKQAVPTWSLSLPYYPGWHYQLDNREIKPSSIAETVPTFREELTPGAHTVIATFTPTMLYWGFLGSLIGLLIALWKSISIRD